MSVANTKEYGEGYSAFEEGKEEHANPYLRSSPMGRRWSTGYHDAKDDSSDKEPEPAVFDNEIISLAVEESSK